MKPRIGFVDDDKFYALRWIDDLNELFEVVYFRSAADAHLYISSHTDLRCLVLDVMMPTPTGVPEGATAEGTETGIWLLRQLDEFIRAYPLPVIVLTNRNPDSVEENIASQDFPTGLIEVHRKLDTPRKKLRELVTRMVTTVHN